MKHKVVRLPYDVCVDPKAYITYDYGGGGGDDFLAIPVYFLVGPYAWIA